MKEIPYVHEEQVHNKKSASIILPILFDIYKPQSLLDVGCGLATWVAVATELGVADAAGIDGDYVPREKLAIPLSEFIAQDLTQPFNLKRKYDLIVSLEVAEHLPEANNESFISTLVNHGDVVLFSAALPGQGGQNHINEQWLSYWVRLFGNHGYHMYDVLRPKIWTNTGIEFWYKQNIVLFCKEGHVKEELFRSLSSPYIDIVHPERFASLAVQAERANLFEEGKLGTQMALQSLTKSIVRKLK